MSRTCEICKRGPKKAVSRSHSNIATLRRQYLNLQKRRIDGKIVKICVKCIKSLNTSKVK
ncbi:MAG: 50S ribosomal protein L28 [Parcubacteria group bacterium]|nr:50S ribosomal protein L28 [Parcubacteria group bacterium]